MSSWSSKIGGMIYCAPVGTALPTDLDSILPEAYTRIGYITSDGIQNAQDRTVSQFRKWTGAMVGTTSSHAKDTWKFDAIEITDPAINRAMYGKNNVAEGDDTFTVSISEGDSDILSWVFDVELWHGLKKRVVMPKAKIIAREDVVHNGESLISLGVTLLALADENKRYHYEYVTTSATTPGEEPQPERSWGERIEDLEGAMTDVQNDVEGLDERLDQSEENIAPDFSTSGNYAPGSMVVYGGVLYRFIASHPAGAWIGTDAEQVSLGTEAYNARALLSGANAALSKIGGLRVVEWETGCNIPSPAVGQSMNYTRVRDAWYRCCAVVPISPGEALNWSGRAGAQAVGLAYVFVDEDDVVLSRASSNLAEPTTVIAPEGAAAVVLNNYTMHTGNVIAPIAFIGDSAWDISHAVAANQRTVESIHSLIKYCPDYNESVSIAPGVTTASSLGISRVGNLLTLNKTVASTQTIRARLSGKLSRAGSTSGVAAWSGGLEVGKDLIAGHKYRAKITYVGGISKYEADSDVTYFPPAVGVFATGSSSNIGTATRGSHYAYRDWTAAAGKTYNVAIVMGEGYYFFDNAQFIFTVEDLTGNVDMVAAANIESGQYFSIGNNLYLATRAIASGAAVVPGTNCIETALADALTALGAPFIVEQSERSGGGRILNKTWQEIRDKFVSGATVYITTPPEWDGEEWDSVVRVVEDEVDVCHVWTSNGWEWLSSSAGQYPTHT